VDSGLTIRNTFKFLLISVPFCGTLPSNPHFLTFYFEYVPKILQPVCNDLEFLNSPVVKACIIEHFISPTLTNRNQ
jgi:hypothetical protein